MQLFTLVVRCALGSIIIDGQRHNSPFALRQLQQADSGNGVGLPIVTVNNLMFLGGAVYDSKQIVIPFRHRVILSRIRVQRAVARQHGFIEKHVHTGQDGIGSIGQTTETVTARYDFGQARREN